jgi:hypothetical protein
VSNPRDGGTLSATTNCQCWELLAVESQGWWNPSPLNRVTARVPLSSSRGAVTWSGTEGPVGWVGPTIGLGAREATVAPRYNINIYTYGKTILNICSL